MPPAMQWRACEGFPDYEISEAGDLRRATNSVTRKVGWRHKGFINSDGYLEYALRDGHGEKHHVTAHVLVATAFIGPAPSPAHEVAHSNGSRIDCRFENLRWDTRKGNHTDLQRHGTALKGERNGRARLRAEDVLAICSEHARLKRERHPRPLVELSGRFGVHASYICNFVKGKSWSHLRRQGGGF